MKPVPSTQEQVASFFGLSQILRDQQIKHWIDFGTLLGAARHGGLIPNDPDMDFDFLAEDRERILALKEVVFERTNLVLTNGDLVRAFPFDHGIPLDNEFEAARMCTERGLLYLDLYACEVRDREVFHVMPCYNFKRFFVEELGEIEFEGFTFPAPRHKADLLANRYGSEWRVPMALGEFRRRERDLIIPFSRPVTVYVQGAFDLFHIGHLNLFRKAKELFDRLVVGVDTDESIRKYKRQPVIPHRDRLEIVRACRSVDDVVENPPFAVTMDFMQSNQLDYVLAGEASPEFLRLFWEEPIRHDKLHLVPRTAGVCSSDIIERCRKLDHL